MKQLHRCDWANHSPLEIHYHDHEWGVPVHDDQTLFEFLLLESMQAGLSWYTVLLKREHFKEAFDQFDYRKIACYTDEKLDELMQNKNIIRNRLKIQASVTNAHAFMGVQEEFGSFAHYIWNFVDHKPIQNRWKSVADVPTTTSLSDRISKDLKKRGFKFVGSTIIYSYLQAVGVVNDHLVTCFKYLDIQNNKGNNHTTD